MDILLGFVLGGIFMWIITHFEIISLNTKIKIKDDQINKLTSMLDYEKEYNDELRERFSV